MDKITHEVRLSQWKAIVEQCQARPKGVTVITFNTINGQHGEEPLGFTISTKAPAASPTFYSFDDLYWVYTKCPSVIDIALGVIKLSKMSNGDMILNGREIDSYEIVKK